MKNAVFATLAVLGVVFGTLALAPNAQAVWVTTGSGSSAWQEEPQG